MRDHPKALSAGTAATTEPIFQWRRTEPRVGYWVDGPLPTNSNWEFETRVIYTAEALEALQARVSELEVIRDQDARVIADVVRAIVTTRFMDPPDGGDVSLGEQVRRMWQVLQTAEAKVAELTGLVKRLRKSIDRDSGGSALELNWIDAAIRAMKEG